PALTSLLCVLAYLQWKRTGKGRFEFWLVLSGVFLGLTAASKYMYCVIGFAILIDWFLDAKEQNDLGRFYKQVFVWGILAIVVFFAADPYLWPDPIGRLKESLLYHAAYTSGAAEVQNASSPAWQPLYWLFWSPYWSYPGVFAFPFDILITVIAVLGLKRLWGRNRLFALWLGVALTFLLFWPTKWPQYILILTVPLSMAAAEGVMSAWEPLAAWWQRRQSGKARVYERNEIRRALPWLVPGLIAFALLTILPLLFQFSISMTDFSSASIRDGFNGGLWRAISQGLTGQEPVKPADILTRTNKVNFTGLTAYAPALDYIAQNGILFFNVFWTVLSVLLQAALGLGVALLLRQRGVRLGRFWQALFILPWAIPEMIGAVMWVNIFQPTSGWLALAAAKFGETSFPGMITTAFDKSPSLWLLAYLLPAIWYGFPFMMLASSVGLKSIPRDVFDAAAIDGATPGQTFRFVTWPLLLPLLLPALIVHGIFSFNQFYLFQVFGYWDATLATLSYNVFNPNSGFASNAGQFALSAVLNILTVIILITFVLLFNGWSKADEGVTYA
ncbi:MAG TPA: ABC transporter permease subunit, partial [Anaerolineales bacterium]